MTRGGGAALEMVEFSGSLERSNSLAAGAQERSAWSGFRISR